MRRRPRLSPASLEELLDGGRVSDAAPLSRVLAAARAPGTPDETSGLDAARAAFLRAPHAARPPTRHRPTASRTAAGRLIALKAVAAISGATLIGGVAYATSNTGILGGSSHHPAPQPSGTTQSGTSSVPGYGGVGSSSAGGGSVRPTRAVATEPQSEPSRAARSEVVAATVPTKSHGPRTTPAHHPTSSTHVFGPTRTAAPTPTGHAQTTPPQRPTDPAGTHSIHPTPTAPRG